MVNAVRTRLEPASAGMGLAALALSTLPPAAKGGCPLGGRVPLVRDVHIARKGVQDQGPKLPFCGADEARTRDPRRDRPVF